MSKEDFKSFVKTRPELASYVKDGSMSWQEFYELYDLFGTDEKIWSKYPPQKESSISEFMDKIDTNVIQKHLTNAQKTLDLISELTSKGNGESNISIPETERPLEKFFGD